MSSDEYPAHSDWDIKLPAGGTQRLVDEVRRQASEGDRYLTGVNADERDAYKILVALSFDPDSNEGDDEFEIEVNDNGSALLYGLKWGDYSDAEALKRTLSACGATGTVEIHDYDGLSTLLEFSEDKVREINGTVTYAGGKWLTDAVQAIEAAAQESLQAQVAALNEALDAALAALDTSREALLSQA